MLALLVQRETPASPTGVGPSKLLVSRPLRTTFLIVPDNLKLHAVNQQDAVAAGDARLT